MRSLFLFCLLFGVISKADVLIGTARDLQGQILYTERHEIERDQDQFNRLIKVSYTDSQGNVFARMISDFSKNRFVPETEFEDDRFSVKKTLHLTPEKKVIFRFFKNGKETETNSHPLTERMVASQGFDNFIRQNFEQLQKEQVPLYFGVLSELDFFSLTAYPKKKLSENRTQFGIRLSNFLLRMVADELVVEYDNTSKTILKYKGRSNLWNQAGKAQTVEIEYSTSESIKK